MKIVADENIPSVGHYFKNVSQLVLKPGRDITREDLLDADCLLVRSVTPVNEALLSGTRVKFVGSSASGKDHLDTAWLEKAGIKWFAAEGCNTQAVVDYVVSVVALLKKQALFPDRQLRAGVIGVGKIGSRVAEKLVHLGFEVLLCDPLRAAKEKEFVSTSLADFKELGLITLHMPLTFGGPEATFHLIDKDFLLRQQKGCVLLNSSRGAVIDSDHLQEYGEHLYWCLDVWENEPYIGFAILEETEVAAPHIAGYSVESKLRGVEMIYQALTGNQPPVMVLPKKTISFSGEKVAWFDVILKVYDPSETTAEMKRAIMEDGSGKAFDLMRKNFNTRREFSGVEIVDVVLTEKDRALLDALLAE